MQISEVCFHTIPVFQIIIYNSSANLKLYIARGEYKKQMNNICVETHEPRINTILTTHMNITSYTNICVNRRSDTKICQMSSQLKMKANITNDG